MGLFDKKIVKLQLNEMASLQPTSTSTSIEEPKPAKVTKGFKAMNKGMTSSYGYQFAIGETYKQEGKLKVCHNGFHFSGSARDCFDYYDFDQSTIICEIEAYGETDWTYNGNGVKKYCCSEIKILRQLSLKEVLKAYYYVSLANEKYLTVALEVIDELDGFYDKKMLDFVVDTIKEARNTHAKNSVLSKLGIQ